MGSGDAVTSTGAVLGHVPVQGKDEGGGGVDGEVPVMTIRTTTNAMIRRCRPCSWRGGRTLCPPSQDLMHSNVERNFWMPLLLGNAIISC
jgi:hypothetical protein